MGYKVWTRRRRITKAVLDQVKHVEDVNILHYLKFVRGWFVYRWVHLVVPALMAVKVFSSLKLLGPSNHDVRAAMDSSTNL